MHQSIRDFLDWCAKHNKKPSLISSLDEYNRERGWKSKYVGRRVQVYEDGSYKLI